MTEFKVFKDPQKNIVTFVTDNISYTSLAEQEIKEQVKDGCDKRGPFKFSNGPKDNWSIIYKKRK